MEVQKEDISNFSFPNEEVLTDPSTIDARAKTLVRAASLGNLNKFKVKIVFEDNEALKMVNTTIWAASEKNIVLKAGVTIPRHRIHLIDFLED